MGISFIRCDERLIHGQCITGVLRDYQIQHVILVDDETSGNPIFKRIYEIAVPSSVKIDVSSVSDSFALIEAARESTLRTLILFKELKAFDAISRNVSLTYKDLNIGPMSNRKDYVKITYYTHLSCDDIKILERLTEDGFNVYFQQTLDQKQILWRDVRSDILKKCV